MKEQIVTALSVAALVAFAFGANAQGPDTQQGGTKPSSPMTQPSGPSGPSSAESGRPEGGQAGQPSTKEGNKAAETGDKDKMDRDRKSAETGDRDHMDRDRKSAETGDRDHMDRDRKSAETGDRDRDHKAGDRTTVKIDSGEKEKVRTYFSQHRPTTHRVEKSRVSVSIGVALPTGIALAPLPPSIIVAAADCPLQYFVWGDDVVLVDSCSREVVDIIPNIG